MMDESHISFVGVRPVPVFENTVDGVFSTKKVMLLSFEFISSLQNKLNCSYYHTSLVICQLNLANYSVVVRF